MVNGQISLYFVLWQSKLDWDTQFCEFTLRCVPFSNNSPEFKNITTSHINEKYNIEPTLTCSPLINIGASLFNSRPLSGRFDGASVKIWRNKEITHQSQGHRSMTSLLYCNPMSSKLVNSTKRYSRRPAYLRVCVSVFMCTNGQLTIQQSQRCSPCTIHVW